MKRLLVVCHNPDCRDSVENNPKAPREMHCNGETFSAWTFQCLTCGARRAVTKDQIGGVFGATTRRDDGTVAFKYVEGWKA